MSSAPVLDGTYRRSGAEDNTVCYTLGAWQTLIGTAVRSGNTASTATSTGVSEDDYWQRYIPRRRRRRPGGMETPRTRRRQRKHRDAVNGPRDGRGRAGGPRTLTMTSFVTGTDDVRARHHELKLQKNVRLQLRVVSALTLSQA